MTPDARTLLEQALREAVWTPKGHLLDSMAATPSGTALLDLAGRAIAAEAERDRLVAAMESVLDIECDCGCIRVLRAALAPEDAK